MKGDRVRTMPIPRETLRQAIYEAKCKTCGCSTGHLVNCPQRTR